ncbi:MAG TPA: glycosyltransferase family 4 protein [Firmicutes bacterium]|nr:glycosyltransferase family 4 protein [Bacillota bacterium]
MRILMLSWEFPPQVVGGLARHVHGLSLALAEAREDVSVITLAPEGDLSPSREDLAGAEIHRIKPYPLAASSFPLWALHMNIAMLEKAVVLANRNPFDLVHAHDWLVAYAGRALKHIYRIPLIATIHATEYGRNGGLYSDEQRYISDVEWWLAYEAWRVICCSDYMRKALQRLFQVPEDKLKVIYNGVTPELFQAREEEDPVAGPASQERIIFYIGRLVPEKGVQILLQAAPRILDACPAARFVIAGDGPYRGELEELASRMGIKDKVHFPGFIADKERNRLYRQAAVSVIPSLYEPFGIVALEAMAAGAPLVVADCGGLGEIVTHDVNGLKCYPGHAVSLADQVIRLLTDAGLSASLREAGKKLVMAKYTWPQIAAETAAVYREVLEEYDSGSWKTAKGEPELAYFHGLSKQLSRYDSSSTRFN